MQGKYPDGGWLDGDSPLTDEAIAFPDDAEAMNRLYWFPPAKHDLFAISFQDITSNFDGRGTFAVTANGDSPNALHFPRNRVQRGDSWRNARVGDTVDFRICLGNKGGLTAPTGGQLKVFLSTDQVITLSDPVSATVFTYPGFYPYDLRCDTLYFQVPSVAVNTWYYVAAWFNADGTRSGRKTILNRRIKVVP